MWTRWDENEEGFFPPRLRGFKDCGAAILPLSEMKGGHLFVKRKGFISDKMKASSTFWAERPLSEVVPLFSLSSLIFSFSLLLLLLVLLVLVFSFSFPLLFGFEGSNGLCR